MHIHIWMMDLGKGGGWMKWMDGIGFGFQLLLSKCKCWVIRESVF